MPSYAMDFKNWPRWVKDMLPEDLLNAYGNIQTSPVKSSGRKSAINNDNVSDLSYYYFKNRKQGITEPLKGTDKTPLDYAYEKMKIKCFCFLYKDNDYSKEHAKKLKSLYDKYKDDENFKWFKYFCIFNATPEMFKPDEIYDFILNSSSPYENLLIVANKYRYIKATEVLQNRNNKNKGKDVEFYSSLNRNQKLELSRIVRIEKYQFEIEDVINNEHDLEIIFTYYFSTLRVIQTALKYNLLDEFKQFVDNHQNLFKNFRNFKMIHPKYRKLYPIAFKDQSWNKFLDARIHEKGKELSILEEDICDYIENQLIPNKCWDEIIYLMQKKYELRHKHIKEILKALNYRMIDFIKKEVPEDDFIGAQNEIFIQGHESIEEFIKLGYHPSIYVVGHALVEREVQSLELIERFIPSNMKLDPLKKILAQYGIDRLPAFLSKYSDRLESLDIDSYNMQHDHKNYPKLCEILGVEYVKSESEPESSSSDYKRPQKRSVSRTKTSNKPQNKRTQPYKICYKCSQQNICMFCGKSYKFHNGMNAYVCESHSQKIGSKCPICNKGTASHTAMICSSCQNKQHIGFNQCFKCKK